MKSETLDVYLLGECIGELRYEGDRLNFVYSEEYLNGENPFPLSNALPLKSEPFEHEVTEPFFSGLLPDDAVRQRLAEYLRVSEGNTFRLLEIIGGECAGGISLYKKEHPSSSAHDNDYKFLTDRELKKLLQTIRKQPMMAGTDNIRISGAGAQDKLVVAMIDDKVGIPKGNTPSTHFIKPAIRDIDDSVHNEYFCMKLAEKIGLNTAKASIYSIDEESYYLTERYDRVKQKDKTIHRLHQEDFCQALQIPPTRKYENEGGPSFTSCYELIDAKVSAGDMRGVSRLEFFKVAVFNFLIGNGDAHGKNFSLLYEEEETKLAPFYDLMSTSIYANSFKATMAMKIGGKYKFQDVYREHLVRLGCDFKFKERFCNDLIDELANSIVESAKELIVELDNSGEPAKIYHEILKVIVSHTKRLKY